MCRLWVLFLLFLFSPVYTDPYTKEGWKKIKDSNFNDIIHPNYSEFFTKEMQDQIIGKDIEVIKDNNNYKDYERWVVIEKYSSNFTWYIIDEMIEEYIQR